MVNPTIDPDTLARRKPIGEALNSKDSLLPTMPTGIHKSTPPTLADGDVAPTQLDDLGNAKVSLGDPAQIADLKILTPPSSISDGSKVVASAGTAVALIGSSTPCRKVMIKAKEGNTGNVYIGGSSVDNTRGIPLLQGEKLEMEINDVQKIYMDADNNDDGVTFIYLA